MSGALHVTEAESELLEALWRLGPMPPARLIAEVRRGRDWSATTVKTLLARLKHKDAVRAERADGSLRYRPTVTRDDYVAGEVDRLVARCFGGERAALADFLRGRGGG